MSYLTSCLVSINVCVNWRTIAASLILLNSYMSKRREGMSEVRTVLSS